ncbi:flagellar biosynthesis repressor FlbT [Parvularcula sp. LCG005]|uniref:flagellar biosynthesis repressor FlbT n=1 Tax=Parvularcula sp. LCG005 TaxID=3078805 RepID=UPI002942592F|nr:flagellar biosynthesis repressor FlbT [Parvularcula sp. LCG005]WOI52680.1 flagellar biosynthesis repressor FlbT [Parvularcula sp. LCG005]
MSGGLTLTLRPGEKFLVGGNLIQNGPRRSSVRICDDGVFVLRLSDALHPEEVTTPVRRAYHVAQMILATETSVEEGQTDLIDRLTQLCSIFEGTPEESLLARCLACAEEARFYGVLMGLKSLFTVEDRLLQTGVADDTYAAKCAIAGRR